VKTVPAICEPSGLDNAVEGGDADARRAAQDKIEIGFVPTSSITSSMWRSPTVS
jgi:hypothetical protein